MGPSLFQIHPVNLKKKRKRRRRMTMMMMMMATSPSMIFGEILMRTRRTGKRTPSQVMAARLKRKAPRFRNLRDRGQSPRRDQGQGPRTLLRNVRDDHGPRARRAARAHRDLGPDQGRSESLESEDQEALRAHLQVGPGLGAERRTRRRSQRSGQRKDQDLVLERRGEEDHPLAADPEVAQDGQGAPSPNPRDELEAEE